MTLTPEQIEKVELYERTLQSILAITEILKEKLQVQKTKWAALKLNLLANEQDIKSLVLPNEDGTYPSYLQDSVDNNVNPYYLFEFEVKTYYHNTVVPELRTNNIYKNIEEDTLTKLEYTPNYITDSVLKLDNLFLNPSYNGNVFNNLYEESQNISNVKSINLGLLTLVREILVIYSNLIFINGLIYILSGRELTYLSSIIEKSDDVISNEITSESFLEFNFNPDFLITTIDLSTDIGHLIVGSERIVNESNYFTPEIIKEYTLLKELENASTNSEEGVAKEKIEAFKEEPSKTEDLEEIVSRIETTSKIFCENVTTTIKTSPDFFISEPSVSSDIYSILIRDQEVINKLKDFDTKEDYVFYEPFKKIRIVVDNNISFKSWCSPSKRIPEAFSKSRHDYIKEKVAQLKAAESNSKVGEFNKLKEELLIAIETDLYLDIAFYYVGIELFNLNNTSRDNSLYIQETSNYNIVNVASLQFNAPDIIQELINLHFNLVNYTVNEDLVKELKKEQEDIEPSTTETSTTKNSDTEKAKEKREEIDTSSKENWGIKITSVNNIPITVSEDLTKNPGETLTEEEKANIQTNEPQVSLDNKSWYMTLLPAMTSNLPVTGGSQPPGAQPGLNFKIVNSLIKHKIPGFGPIYQPMGIDTINCTIVGCFTGADGFDKNEVGSIETFTQAGNKISPDLLGRDGQLGFGTGTFLNTAVTLYDSFDNYQSFYTAVIEPNKEIEVEINLRKNTSVLKNGSEGIFRDKITGNPKFKGYIKRFDTYYVRADRMWYIMDVQLTTNKLTSRKCLNLTNIIEESRPTEEQLELDSIKIDSILNCFFNGSLPLDYKKNRLPFVHTTSDYIHNSSNGIIIPNKSNSAEKLAVSKDGYSAIYTVDATDSSKRYLQKGPIAPPQTFIELQKDKWNLRPIDKYYLMLKTVDYFETRQAENRAVNPVGSVLKVNLRDLDITAKATEQNRRGVDIITEKLKVRLQYDLVSGDLVETDSSKVQNRYSFTSLMYGSFHRGGVNGIGQDGGLQKNLLEFLISLKDYIVFKQSTNLERCFESETTSTKLGEEAETSSSTKPNINIDFSDLKVRRSILVSIVEKIQSNSNREEYVVNEPYFDVPRYRKDHGTRIKNLGELVKINGFTTFELLSAKNSIVSFRLGLHYTRRGGTNFIVYRDKSGVITKLEEPIFLKIEMDFDKVKEVVTLIPFSKSFEDFLNNSNNNSKQNITPTINNN